MFVYTEYLIVWKISKSNNLYKIMKLIFLLIFSLWSFNQTYSSSMWFFVNTIYIFQLLFLYIIFLYKISYHYFSLHNLVVILLLSFAVNFTVLHLLLTLLSCICCWLYCPAFAVDFTVLHLLLTLLALTLFVLCSHPMINQICLSCFVLDLYKRD